MTDKTLLKRVSLLGLSLMEPNEDFDVNRTLAEVVKSREMRLWEGFPVLLVNAAKDARFDYERVMDNLSAAKEKGTFRALLLLSLALYDFHHLSFFWMNRLKDGFSDMERAKLKQLRNSLSHDDLFSFEGTRFQSARLKKMFELHFEKDTMKSSQRNDKYAELSFEYSLSQLFPPKQKELFKKKLDGLLLTKTEKEYYSRTVKKKVAALANSELHRMAQKLMQY